MRDMKELVDWFLHSSIYENGAYRAYCSKDSKGPFYPEATAYAISLSCILYRKEHQEIFIDRAMECAKYLMNVNKNGGLHSYIDTLLYTFDTGIFISSMLDIHEILKSRAYLNAAERSLKWLCLNWDGKQFSATDGVSTDKTWSHVSSVHLAKLSIPLIKASIFLNDFKYQEIAIKLLETYKNLQLEDGRFIINEGSNRTMTHAHCYATEGFLYAYYYLKDKELLRVAEKAINWLSKAQNSDGSFYRWYSGSDVNTKPTWIAFVRPQMRREKATDATAQATRLWKLSGVNKKGIEKAYNYIEGLARSVGLGFGDAGRLRNMVRRLHYGSEVKISWPTFFYIHSLLLPFNDMEYVKGLF